MHHPSRLDVSRGPQAKVTALEKQNAEQAERIQTLAKRLEKLEAQRSR